MQITVDISGLKDIQKMMQGFSDPKALHSDKLAREIATTLCAEIIERVHEKGIKTDGTPIGTYSAAYLKKRAKKNFSGNRVVLVFERQMESDLSIGVTSPTKLSEGGYGLGYKNKDNYNKHLWATERYGKIFSPSKGEREMARLIAIDYINRQTKAA